MADLMTRFGWVLLTLLLAAPALAQTDPPPAEVPLEEPPEEPPPPSLEGDVIPAPESLGNPPAPALSILYEGGTGGISGAQTDLLADTAVADALAGDGNEDWTRRAAGWGAFHQDGRWILQADGGVGRFRSQAAPSVELAGEALETRFLVADDYAIFVWPISPSDGEAADATLAGLHASLGADPLHARPAFESVLLQPSVAADGLETLFARRPEAASELNAPLDPDRWEVRLRTVFQSSFATVYVVSRLQGEGARRFALIDGFPRDHRLYLAAGDCVEGRSYLEGTHLSLQRPNTWAAWKALGLDALAPGEAELAAGPGPLREEAKAAGIPLLSVNLVDPDGNALFDRWAIRDVGGRRIALIGWTDPAALARLSPEFRAGLRARGSIAVDEAVAELAALPQEERPDLTILFGVGSRELAGHLPGVTIVLGDFTTRLRLAPEIEVGAEAVRNYLGESPGGRAPLLVSRLGPQYVGRIELQFEDGEVSRLLHQRIRIDERLPADADQVAAVQSVRQEVYASHEDILVPDLSLVPWPHWTARSAPPSDLDAGVYLQTAANLLMDRTGADFAFLRPLKIPVDVPGPTASLFVDASLAVPDQVSVIEITGLKLRLLLLVVEAIAPQAGVPGWGAPEDPEGLWAWSAGIVRVGRKITVRGRLVRDTDVLYLATSSFFDQDPRVVTVLGPKTLVWRNFAGTGWQRSRSGSRTGSPWSLHDLVKGGLVHVRALDPEFQVRYGRAFAPLTVDQSRWRSGRLTLEFDGLAFQVTGSLRAGSLHYDPAQETRVIQDNYFATSLRGRFALVWDGRVGSLTGYGEGVYGQNQSSLVGVALDLTQDRNELEDDLEFGAIASLRLLKIPTPGTAILVSLFLQGAYDTEFTVPKDTDLEDDYVPQRQRILRSTAGANLGKFKIFKEARAGAFLEVDLNNPEELAPGLTLFGKLERKFGLLKTTGTVDFRGYFVDPNAGEDEVLNAPLVYTLQLRGELAGILFAKAIPGLAIGGFVDALLFQGQGWEPGLHLLIGASLSYDADLRPPIRLR
jgi:hypothetical protein